MAMATTMLVQTVVQQHLLGDLAKLEAEHQEAFDAYQLAQTAGDTAWAAAEVQTMQWLGQAIAEVEGRLAALA